MRVQPLEPRRVRYPKGAYGWVDLRVVTDGHLQALDPAAALTYLFLCTVGNREGVSFWSRTRMARTLNLPPETVDAALHALATAGLIVATERVVQVLPIPGRDATEPARQTTSPPPPAVLSPPTQDEREVSDAEINAHEPEARARIARFYGTREPVASVVRALARSLALKGRP